MTHGTRWALELVPTAARAAALSVYQVASIWAGTKGKIDDVPVEDVRRFESELLDHLRRNTDVLSTIAETGKLSDETEAQLSSAVDACRSGFLTGDGTPLVGGDTEDEAETEIEQEQIVRQKRA